MHETNVEALFSLVKAHHAPVSGGVSPDQAGVAVVASPGGEARLMCARIVSAHLARPASTACRRRAHWRLCAARITRGTPESNRTGVWNATEQTRCAVRFQGVQRVVVGRTVLRR